MTNGITLLETFRTGLSAIPLATKSVIPTGGVTRPIQNVVTITTPNWIGLIPIAFAAGTRIGAKIRTAGTGSKNIPTKRRITDTSNRKIVGLLEMLRLA